METRINSTSSQISFSSEAFPLWLILWGWFQSLLLYLEELAQENQQLRTQIIALEEQLKQNSSNSSRPPSSDSPYQKPSLDSEKKSDSSSEDNSPQKKKKRGALPGHEGHGPQLLPPSYEIPIHPTICACGCEEFRDPRIYYTHQQVELPPIALEVTHFHLYSALCVACHKEVKSTLPAEHQTGYGPRLTAYIGELAGINRLSRSTIQQHLSSLFGLSISQGTLQKVIDRVSTALGPHYEAIGQIAGEQEVNYIDETPWFQRGSLLWLWVMVSARVGFFKIHAHRSKEAFHALIGAWRGILVSDDYGTYVQWVHGRQTCLAHLIRRAQAFLESSLEEEQEFGSKVKTLLQQLCQWAKSPPCDEAMEQWQHQFYEIISRYTSQPGKMGTFARRLEREWLNLWAFMIKEGIEPTNNRAERALRFGVLWRKMSQGSDTPKGNQWVERILSFRETARLQGKETYPLLVEALEAYFSGRQPDLTWIENA
jgi:transposase